MADEGWIALADNFVTQFDLADLSVTSDIMSSDEMNSPIH